MKHKYKRYPSEHYFTFLVIQFDIYSFKTKDCENAFLSLSVMTDNKHALIE